MGVGTPVNILEAVHRGVDFFDCVLPARNGRHGHVYTDAAKTQSMECKYERDMSRLMRSAAVPPVGIIRERISGIF